MELRTSPRTVIGASDIPAKPASARPVGDADGPMDGRAGAVISEPLS
jgi:hypothetical protein